MPSRSIGTEPKRQKKNSPSRKIPNPILPLTLDQGFPNANRRQTENKRTVKPMKRAITPISGKTCPQRNKGLRVE